MSYVIILVLLVAVVWFVSAPVRRRSADPAADDVRRSGPSTRRIDLEAARDAKLREIRDAELDHQTGKLSDDDYAVIDSALRAEAVELLHALDELEEPETGYHSRPR